MFKIEAKNKDFSEAIAGIEFAKGVGYAEELNKNQKAYFESRGYSLSKVKSANAQANLEAAHAEEVKVANDKIAELQKKLKEAQKAAQK